MRPSIGSSATSASPPAPSCVEPDGFVSPYSETLQVDVPRDWSALGLLLPLLLLF